MVNRTRVFRLKVWSVTARLYRHNSNCFLVYGSYFRRKQIPKKLDIWFLENREGVIRLS